MTKETAAQYLPLVQALVDGKVIQIKRMLTEEWEDMVNTEFSASPELYRIKPGPLECWVNVYSDCNFVAHPTSDGAFAGKQGYGFVRTIRMIEAPEQ